MKRKIITSLFIIFIGIILFINGTSASSLLTPGNGGGLLSPSFWLQSGTSSLIPFDSNFSIGSSTIRIIKGWFTALDTLGLQVNGTSTFGLSTTTSYLQIENDGTPILYGSSTVWEDLRFPATILTLGAVPADMCTFSTSTIRTRCFDGNATLESMDLQIQMPHSMKLDSIIYPHFHFAPTTTATGTVKWNFEYVHANSGSVFPSTSTIVSATTTIATSSQWKSLYTDNMSIDTTGWTLSSMIMARIYRDPNDPIDTYPDDAALQEFDIHYEIDSLGSRQEEIK